MAKTLISDLVWSPRNFFEGFTSTRCYTLLQAITVCNFDENSWTKPEKMAKNPVLTLTDFGTDFDYFAQKLDVNASYHCMQF